MRNSECAYVEAIADDGEPSAGLTHDSLREVGRRNRVHRNGDGTAKHAAEKGGDPFAGIRAPQQNAVAFSDLPRFQFACELIRARQQIRVRPPNGAIAAVPYKCNFGGWPGSGGKQFENGLARHCASSVT